MADDKAEQGPHDKDDPEQKLPVGIMFCAAALGLALLLAIVAAIAFAAMAPRSAWELQVPWPVRQSSLP